MDQRIMNLRIVRLRFQSPGIQLSCSWQNTHLKKGVEEDIAPLSNRDDYDAVRYALYR